LIKLFDKVRFHPLSIAVLAQQLKSRKASELGQRLEQLLASEPTALAAGPSHQQPPMQSPTLARTAHEDTPLSLQASLLLSLDLLTDDERQAVRALGVFRGGAFEDDLLAITGLGESDTSEERAKALTILTAIESRDARAILPLLGTEIPDGGEIPEELLAQIPWDELEAKTDELRSQLVALPETPSQNVWPGLRRQLERAALIEAERVPGVGPPFLRFHPTLAPLLWSQLDAAEQSRLTDSPTPTASATTSCPDTSTRRTTQTRTTPGRSRGGNCPTCCTPFTTPWPPRLRTPWTSQTTSPDF
jgi:hypothetical protein